MHKYVKNKVGLGGRECKSMILDNVDYQIIKLLQEDGRMPIKRLSQMVSLTPPAVAERVRKLEKTGVIKGYRAIVDPKKLGKNIKTIIVVTLNPDKRNDFINFANQNKNILECYHVTGGFSMIVKALFEEMADLEKLVGRIQQFGNTQTLIILSSPIENKIII
jgi:Lrp/AsnC family leucine-responsive transcriptional regulator